VTMLESGGGEVTAPGWLLVRIAKAWETRDDEGKSNDRDSACTRGQSRTVQHCNTTAIEQTWGRFKGAVL
jgi:hypothetical protein